MQKTLFKVHVFWVFLLASFLSSCYSESIQLLQTRQFKLQTQVIKLESQNKRNNKKVSTQNKRVAGLHTGLDEYVLQLSQIEGEIDAIKKGFELGKLPGTPDEDQSIDARIRLLDKRLLALEEAQGEIINLLENIEKNASSSSKNRRKKIKTLQQTKKAFKQKRYLHIVMDLPKAIKSSKGKALWYLRYYYAESLYKVGRIHHSALSFKDIEGNSPLSDEKKRMIKLRLGDCFRHLGDKKTALVYYSELLETYPNSKEANYAKSYLKKLRKS